MDDELDSSDFVSEEITRSWNRHFMQRTFFHVKLLPPDMSKALLGVKMNSFHVCHSFCRCGVDFSCIEVTGLGGLIHVGIFLQWGRGLIPSRGSASWGSASSEMFASKGDLLLDFCLEGQITYWFGLSKNIFCGTFYHWNVWYCIILLLFRPSISHCANVHSRMHVATQQG